MVSSNNPSNFFAIKMYRIVTRNCSDYGMKIWLCIQGMSDRIIQNFTEQKHNPQFLNCSPTPQTVQLPKKLIWFFGEFTSKIDSCSIPSFQCYFYEKLTQFTYPQNLKSIFVEALKDICYSGGHLQCAAQCI